MADSRHAVQVFTKSIFFSALDEMSSKPLLSGLIKIAISKFCCLSVNNFSQH